MSTYLISIIMLIVQFALMLGITYLVMNFIVPIFTKKGFGFNRGFWPSIGAVAIMLVGETIFSQVILRLLYVAVPMLVMNIVYNPWYSLMADAVFSSAAIFLTGKYLSNLVFVRSYWTALGAAVVTKVVMILLSLILMLTLTAGAGA